MEPRIIGLYSPASQSGKSTVARFLAAEHGFRPHPFAAPLRGMLRPMLLSLGLTEQQARFHMSQDKAAIIPELGCSGRHLLRTLGTEWGRQLVDPDLWIKCWAAQIEATRDSVVADDVRFPNEARMIQQLGGQVWMIRRPGQSSNTSHPSEGLLDDWDGFSRVIVNGGDLAQLSQSVTVALHSPASHPPHAVP